jgi:RNA polymerase sigma-70 factor (ECF subfamily)
MGNREDGDDLYQDSLVCALDGFASLRKTESFRPWLYRIIINGFKNRIHKPWWRRLVPISSEIEETIGSDNPVSIQAARSRLEIAFRALTPDDRALVTLFELQGWAISDLATITGKSEGNIRVRLSRARSKMREALTRYFKRSDSNETVKSLASKDKVCVVQKPAKD